MSVPESKNYVLKPFKSPAKHKSSSQVPVSTEFLDEPSPDVVCEGRSLCFTGVFIYCEGDREQCKASTRARGGYCYERPNRDLNYLVVGSFAEPAWAHKTYGRKIESALEFKVTGANCEIISEEHWTRFLKNIPELPLDRQTTFEEQTGNHQIFHLQQELQQIHENQKILIDALERELEPAMFQKLIERLRAAGLNFKSEIYRP
jgi:hypothetical protein